MKIDKGKKQRIKKTIAIIIAIVFILFVAVPWVIVKINNSSKNSRPTFTYAQLLERTTADTVATKLFNIKYSQKDKLDMHKEITETLEIKRQMADFSIDISTDNIISLNLVFKVMPDVSVEDWFENSIIKYCCVYMALDSTLDRVAWSFTEDIQGNKDGYFTRDDAFKLINLNVPVEKFGESDTAIQLLLNQFGIEA